MFNVYEKQKLEKRIKLLEDQVSYLTNESNKRAFIITAILKALKEQEIDVDLENGICVTRQT